MTAKLTPHYCDASQLACDIINATFLSLDGFRAMLKEMEASTYRPLDFAAVMARIVDRELGPIVSAAPELLAALKAVEERLTAVAQAFYVTGKPAALRVALMDWKQDIEPARAAIRKAEGGAT